MLSIAMLAVLTWGGALPRTDAACAQVDAGTSSVVGVVRSLRDGKPIKGASVTLNDFYIDKAGSIHAYDVVRSSTRTDSSGRFSLSPGSSKHGQLVWVDVDTDDYWHDAVAVSLDESRCVVFYLSPPEHPL